MSTLPRGLGRSIKAAGEKTLPLYFSIFMFPVKLLTLQTLDYSFMYFYDKS